MKILIVLGILAAAAGLSCQGWGSGEAIHEAGAYSEARFPNSAEREKIEGIADSVMISKGYDVDSLSRSILENLASYEVRYTSESGTREASVYIEKNSYRVLQLVLQP